MKHQPLLIAASHREAGDQIVVSIPGGAFEFAAVEARALRDCLSVALGARDAHRAAVDGPALNDVDGEG